MKRRLKCLDYLTCCFKSKKNKADNAGYLRYEEVAEMFPYEFAKMFNFKVRRIKPESENE